jgi:hypothetical protein
VNVIEITSTYESAEEARTDWSILEEEGVIGVAEVVAMKAADEYGLTLERDDAYQEALLLLATRSRQARAALALGTGALHRWLRQRLRDKHLTEVKHRSGAASYEAVVDSYVPESV